MSKQERFMDIYTLDDLTALVNHNFRAFDKRVEKLARRSRKQEEQIYQLTVRVKKLERSEGE